MHVFHKFLAYVSLTGKRLNGYGKGKSARCLRIDKLPVKPQVADYTVPAFSDPERFVLLPESPEEPPDMFEKSDLFFVERSEPDGRLIPNKPDG